MGQNRCQKGRISRIIIAARPPTFANWCGGAVVGGVDGVDGGWRMADRTEVLPALQPGGWVGWVLAGPAAAASAVPLVRSRQEPAGGPVPSRWQD